MFYSPKLSCIFPLFVLFGLLVSGSCAKTRNNPNNLSICVRIYDRAHVPESELSNARSIADNVLQQAGIHVHWQDCTRSSGQGFLTCDPHYAPTDIQLHLVPQLEKVVPRVGQSALGISLLSENGQPAILAYLDYSRLGRLFASTAFKVQELLGLAVAHEIGHLLLGPNSHSDSGIMRAPWRRRDLERGSWEQFLFTRDQAKQLRAAVQARHKAE
jgi:hypothetical protein